MSTFIFTQWKFLNYNKASTRGWSSSVIGNLIIFLPRGLIAILCPRWHFNTSLGDNSTFNAITLTDEGFETGSSGLKIFTGSATLTGTGSPQVALRWKVTGSSLSGTNKIHGVALQWA